MKKKRKGSGWPRTRVREVGFPTIEAISETRDTAFKKEVRHSLANVVQSPLDRLIEIEDQDDEAKREIQKIRLTNRGSGFW